MVAPAPRIDAVLPSFLEFLGRESVIVGHNVRFDLSFLQAAAEGLGYPPIEHPADHSVMVRGGPLRQSRASSACR